MQNNNRLVQLWQSRDSLGDSEWGLKESMGQFNDSQQLVVHLKEVITPMQKLSVCAVEK